MAIGQIYYKERRCFAEKAESATLDDIGMADDLLDTLEANIERCIGLAGNMIVVNKGVIVFADGSRLYEMFNPRIIKGENPYRTEEACLSLEGTRTVRRYDKIKVRYQNRAFGWR